jgi:putative acyl-CoA dehydrogenase
MSDAFLVLAQAPDGLSCFLVPRVLPNGDRNVFALQRLKDKLGNRSNASSEVEFEGTSGWLVGEEGRGIATIVEMVNFTRLDCALGAASGMRQALVQAIHHARHRMAFGKLLAEQPLMQNVLADLALESEAATLLCLRLARACDQAADDPHEAAIKRIGTALAKFWICKRAAAHAGEALECLGGNGYVEESIMPRLFRESPLNSIWEGSGNVNALDVLRAIRKEPDILDAFFAETARAAGVNEHFDASVEHLESVLRSSEIEESQARGLAEEMAVVLGAAIVVQQSPAVVSDAFCRSRLAGEWGRTFGTLPADADMPAILERAFPA